MQGEPQTRKEREKMRRRRDMLNAALALFSEKGYHNVSMHEIAERAEFAIGTLYKFFENKEDLYKALLMEQTEKFHAAMTEAMQKPGDEVTKLRTFVRVKGELFCSNLPFVRLFLAESRGASFNVKAGLDDDMRKGYEETLGTIAGIFEQGIKNGRFRETAPPHLLASSLDSVINAFLLLSLESPDLHPFPEDPDTILNIFFLGLLHESQ